ncbi:MAG: 3'-5' exonuclease [Acidimicrobiales bacterium]
MAVAKAGEDDVPVRTSPTGLRPFLQFARLPPRALVAARKALDGDEDFRARVAAEVDESGVGRAGWLFLTRPEGWEAEVDALARRVDDDRARAADRRADTDARRRLGAAEEATRRAEEAAATARAEATRAAEALAEERRGRRAAARQVTESAARLEALVTERDSARTAMAAAQAELAAARVTAERLRAELAGRPPPPATGRPLPPAGRPPPPGIVRPPAPAADPSAAEVPPPPGGTAGGEALRAAASAARALADALARAADAGVGGRALTGIADVIRLLETLRAGRFGPGELLERVLADTGYVAELQADGSIEAQSRAENLGELVGTAHEFEALAAEAGEAATPRAFLESVSLVADADDLDPDESSVVLMTLHTAKGLEFDGVFMIGLEDGVFPHLRSLGEPDELEEERRLCYVGITRAQRRLYLTHAWSRMLFGSTQYNPPSRFLKEIPEELTHLVDGGKRRPGARHGREGIVDRAMDAGRVFGSGRGPATPAKTTGAEHLGLAVGDDVVHGKWGEGVVLEVLGSADKAEAVVRFRSVGEKRLLLAWAPLKKSAS